MLLSGEKNFFLLVLGQHRLQISLALSSLLLLLTILLLSLLGILLRSGYSLIRYLRDRRRRKASLALHRSFADLLGGQGQKSGRSLLAHISSSSEPLAGYFALARLAEREGNPLQGAGHMEAGRKQHPELDQLLALEQAHLLLQAGETGKAGVVVDSLPGDLPAAAELRARLALATARLENCAGLLAELSKHGSQLARQLLIAGLAVAESPEAVSSLMKSGSRELEKDLDAGLAEVAARVRLDDLEKAAAKLKSLVSIHLSDEPDGLIDQYLALADQLNTPRKQLVAQLHKWQRADKDSWMLPYALARLSLEAGETEEAEKLLRSSLAQKPGREALLALGDLLQSQGRADEAADCYREALLLGKDRDKLRVIQKGVSIEESRQAEESSPGQT